MKLKVVSQKKNPFLKREEIVFRIESESTPSFDELKKEIGKDGGLVVVRKVGTNFGKKVFLADVVVYDDVEARKAIDGSQPKAVKSSTTSSSEGSSALPTGNVSSEKGEDSENKVEEKKDDD